MLRMIGLALMLVLFAKPGAAGADGGMASKGKNEKIVLLLETTGALKIGKQMASALFTQFLSIWKQKGETPEEKALEKLRLGLEESMDKEMRIGTPLVNEMIKVYSKYYTEKNIDDMLAFYASETGKRVIETLPNVVAESVAIGQKWGQENAERIARDVVKKLKKDGYSIPEI